jgi:diamine N-acetyltransferase
MISREGEDGAMRAGARICEVSAGEQIERSAGIIRRSFAPVALRFALTRENCPTHPSFTEPAALERLHEKGAVLFGAFADGEQVGFMALEDGGVGTFYLEKLAVLPEHRGRGTGSGLIEFAARLAGERGGTRISIGIIDAHDDLKRWYMRRGFRETEVKRFDHLPFAVCFMERAL